MRDCRHATRDTGLFQVASLVNLAGSLKIAIEKADFSLLICYLCHAGTPGLPIRTESDATSTARVVVPPANRPKRAPEHGSPGASCVLRRSYGLRSGSRFTICG